MKKLLLLFLAMPLLLLASPLCLALFTKNELGQTKSNPKLTVDCSCECKGQRANNDTCLECGHKKKMTASHGMHFNEAKQYQTLDLITTHTRTQ